MNRSVAFITAAALGLGAYTTAQAYSGTADVTFTWSAGGNSHGWTSSGPNTFPDPTTSGNNLHIYEQTGNNSTTYYNPDFATASDYTASTEDDCLTPIPGYGSIVLRQYACRITDPPPYYDNAYHAVPITDPSNGAAASGSLAVTDNSLTGTLTVITTTDEPSGATTTVVSGVRTVNASNGTGLNGYNIRSADGSPFGNVWYGITTSAQLTVNLTGTFTASAWTINGGTVRINDPGFACQQGGSGGTGAGTLCTPSITGGGFQTNGGHLSWGIDPDGAATGTSTPIAIEVRNSAGTTVFTTYSGVLADLDIDGSGGISTDYGEFRYAAGSNSGGCINHVRWNAGGISCGTVSTGPLDIVGAVTPGFEANAFIDQTGVALSTQVESNEVSVVSGSNVAIAVTGGEYSIDGGAYTSTAGTVSANQIVTVRQTSSATGGTATDTVLTINGVSDTFTVTTVVPPDTTPDPYTIAAQTGVAVSTAITSAPVQIQGINADTAISVTGGEYAVSNTTTCGTFGTAAGVITNNQYVCVRQTSSAAFNTATLATLTVGGDAEDFSVTTAVQDTTPPAFSFNDENDVAVSTLITSDPVTITGINSPAAITVTGGAYSVGAGPACNGTYVTTAGTVSSGQVVCAQHTSSADEDTDTVTTVTIGGVAGTFTSTTEGGVDPEEPLRDGDGGSSLDLLILSLLGLGGLMRRRRAQ